MNVAATFSPSCVFNVTSARVNVAVIFSLFAVTLIVSVAAFAVAVGRTFRLKVSPTVPISSLTFTAVFVVSDTIIQSHTHLHTHVITHTHDGNTHTHTIEHDHRHRHVGDTEKHEHKMIEKYINCDEHRMDHLNL